MDGSISENFRSSKCETNRRISPIGKSVDLRTTGTVARGGDPTEIRAQSPAGRTNSRLGPEIRALERKDVSACLLRGLLVLIGLSAVAPAANGAETRKAVRRAESSSQMENDWLAHTQDGHQQPTHSEATAESPSGMNPMRWLFHSLTGWRRPSGKNSIASTQDVDASEVRSLSTTGIEPLVAPPAYQPASPPRLASAGVAQQSHRLDSPAATVGGSPVPVAHRALSSSDEWQAEPSGSAMFPQFAAACDRCEYTHQFLPDGVMYKSYVAGEKEPRFASQWLNESGRGLIWESAIGGRFGLYRYGTRGAVRPQGWQWDLEGAVFSRIDPEQNSDLDSADFRFGSVLTRRRGPMAWKVGYYHISSHVGDEFLLRNPGFDRLNYVRDSLLAGVVYDVARDVSVYFETAVAPSPSGGAEPWEFQFGAQYSPLCPSGKCGDPFAAVNVHLREEFDFGGSINVLAGWQWRSAISDRTLRAGFQHYNGKSMQYSFFDDHEALTGFGLWLDY